MGLKQKQADSNVQHARQRQAADASKQTVTEPVCRQGNLILTCGPNAVSSPLDDTSLTPALSGKIQVAVEFVSFVGALPVFESRGTRCTQVDSTKSRA